MNDKKIYVFAPGGRTARGGMGRMVAHLTDRLTVGGDIGIETIDTYGPHVNEASAKLEMPLHFAAAIARLTWALIRGRIRLAHVHMAAWGSVYRKSVVMLACRAFAVPVILHIHGGDLDQFCATLDRCRFAMFRWILGGVCELIVVGEHWRSFAVETLGVPRDRVTIVYNGAPRPDSVPSKIGRAGCEILFLGMVWREKGMEELLTALSSPQLRASDWRMTIAGIGSIEKYQALARDLAIADRVDFVGWADQAATKRLLERADMLVLPSHFECFPMAVIEAMAYGLPVVATAVGAVGEAIADEETGLLVPVGDSGRLGQAIKRLVDDPRLRQSMGLKARKRFCERFDLDIFERRIREIYDRHALKPDRRAAAKAASWVRRPKAAKET